MLTIRFGSDGFDSPCTLVLGGFDGLHLGHRALISRAKRTCLPIGLTTILGGKGKVLFTRSEREFLFERAGVFFVCEILFTEKVKATRAEDFAKEIFSHFTARHVICGEDFHFGYGALGTPSLLKEIAPCPVEIVPAVMTDSMCTQSEGTQLRKISTSVCKDHLKRGALSLLNACLETSDFYGSAYFVQGIVEHGREMGRTYGFPTLNISVPAEKLLPPDGVYGGLAATPKGNYPCIINLGPRPTFGIGERCLEAHLDGFSGNLYGASVRIYPTEFYRPIRSFPSAEALGEQLEKDIGRLRQHVQ